ncbi:MAG: hypothetical protein IJI24_04770 [Lachnospiraceae bacterium]|nr:hypothetical protein [Lachnospiraceae bacterium]
MGSTVQPFIFEWLQKHLDHYQYRTDEARKLKDQIAACDILSQDDQLLFPTLYSSFVAMSEKNPFAGTDEKGEDAGILADALPYFFYPNSIGEYQPLGVQFEWGAMGAGDRAAAFNSRMEKSIRNWSVEAAEGYRRKKERFYAGREQVQVLYGKLLEKGINLRTFWFLQLLVLVLIFLTGLCVVITGVSGGFGQMFHKSLPDVIRSVSGAEDVLHILTSLKEYISLQGIVFVLVALIALVMLLKSLVWISREASRQALIANWKELSTQQDTETDEENTATGFRRPDQFSAIFQELLTEAAASRYTPSDETGDTGALLTAKDKVIDYDRYLQKKSLRSCNTVRGLHVVLMALCLLAVLLASPETIVPPLTQFQSSVRERVKESGFFDRLSVRNTSLKMEDLQDTLSFGLYVNKENTALMRLPSSKEEDVMAVLDRGSALIFLNCIRDEDGALWYEVGTLDGRVGYAASSGCLFRRPGDIHISRMSVVNRERVEKNIHTDILVDGLIEDYVAFSPGDTLTVQFEEKYRLQAMYVLCEPDYEPAFQEADIVVGPLSEYDIQTQEYGNAGVFVRLPDTPADVVQLTFKGDTNEPLHLMELIFYGERIG